MAIKRRASRPDEAGELHEGPPTRPARCEPQRAAPGPTSTTSRRGAGWFPWWSSLDRSRANAVRPMTPTRPITANARMVVLSSPEKFSNDVGVGPRHGISGVVAKSGRQGGFGGDAGLGGDVGPDPSSARPRPSTNSVGSIGPEPAPKAWPKKLAPGWCPVTTSRCVQPDV